MAYVIAVVGAGGKTTYIYDKAKEYIKEGKTVAITTTTKMWLDNNERAKNDNVVAKYCEPTSVEAKSDKIETNLTIPHIAGNKDNEHLLPLSKNEYDTLCNSYDIVLIEADGSKMMPLKIPNILKEPVIPSNVNEIVVIYGMQSIGRKLSVVCQRFDENIELLKKIIDKKIDYDTLVDVNLIKLLYINFYEKELKQKYKDVKISLYLNDMTDNQNYKRYNNIAFVILASGFSKRFGQNKLLYEINNNKLYKIVLNKVINIKQLLLRKFKDIHDYDIKIDISIISQYDDILNDVDYRGLITTIKNDNPDFGQSESIKIGTNIYKDYDAICFYNCDTPNLDDKEIANMIYYYLHSNKNIGAVSYDSVPSNPAIFNRKYYEKLLELVGDVGAKNIINDNIKDCYMYHVDKNILKDIDTIIDL